MKVEKSALLFEGKHKRMYKSSDEDILIMEFKDDITAFNGNKKSQEEGKGKINAQISALLFKLLEENGIKTALVEEYDEKSHLVKNCQILPLEILVRNFSAGKLSEDFKIPRGEKLDFPLIEIYYKNDALKDPLLNDELCLILNLAKSEEELGRIRHIARTANKILYKFFDKNDLQLIDIKLEFGKDKEGNLLLIDELTPDNCRIWDKKSGKSLDRDIFRLEDGKVKETYQEVLKRVKK